MIPLLLALLAAACRAPSPVELEARGWTVDVALERDTKLNGCVVGDVDPRYPGNEIAVVGRDGAVLVVRRTAGGWTSEVVSQSPGELVQCALGDADATRPGPELLVLGMREGLEDAGGPGAALLIYPPQPGARGWGAARIFLEEALLHGGCVADLDPTREGEEILLTGFSRAAWLVFREGGGWSSEPVGELPGAGKAAVPFAGGVALACNDGSVMHAVRKDTGWSLAELDRRPAGRARLAASGGELLVAGDDGVLCLLDAAGGVEELHVQEPRLRGAVLADLDPASPGLEAATAGQGGRIHVLRREGATWRAEEVGRDTAGLHHLAVGELLPDAPGLELVACGESGRLLVLSRPPRDG